MIPSEWKRQRDLVVVALAALFCLLLAALAPAAWLRTVPMLVFVLALPGYALHAGLFPSREIPLLDRSLLVLALSISATALGALLVQLVFDLGRLSWALLLAAVTWAGCAWAVRRRKVVRSDAAPASRPPRLRRGRRAGASAPIGALGTLALLASVGVAVAAIAVAVGGAQERSTVQFAELSVIRPKIAGLPADQIDLEVQNEERRAHDYLVRLRRVDGAPREWSLSLDPGASWQQSLPLSTVPGEGRVRVALYREGDLYRRVDVEGPE